MLSRLGSTDLVPASQRVYRARSYKSLPPSASGGPSGHGHPAHALPGSERRHSAANGSAQPDASDECYEATWTEVVEQSTTSDAFLAAAARAQHIRDAYAATDPIQPRPGLYFRIRA